MKPCVLLSLSTHCSNILTWREKYTTRMWENTISGFSSSQLHCFSHLEELGSFVSQTENSSHSYTFPCSTKSCTILSHHCMGHHRTQPLNPQQCSAGHCTHSRWSITTMVTVFLKHTFHKKYDCKWHSIAMVQNSLKVK